MMKELLSELYQVLGELDAPAKVLDQVAAAIAGQPLPHATLLPFDLEMDPIGHTTGKMHGDVNGNTFFEVKLVGRRRLPFMGQAVYVGAPPTGLPDQVQQLLAALKGVTLTQEQIDMGTTAGEEQHAAARQAIAAAERMQKVENASLVKAIHEQDAAEVAAEADRRQADPGRPQAVGFFSGWVEGGEDGQPVEFMVTAYGDLPREGTKLYALPPRDVLMAFGKDVAEEIARCLPFPGRVDIAAIVDRYVAQPPAQQQAEPVAPAVKESLTADRQVAPVAWVRFCSDGCYEGPLMNSSPAMDGARRTSGAWTPLFAAQPVARDVLMALAEDVRETCWQVGSGDATIRELDLAAIVDRYAAQPPAVAVPAGYALAPIKPVMQQVNDQFVLAVLSWWWHRNNANPENTLCRELEEAGLIPDWFKSHWIYQQDRTPNFGVHSSDIAELIYRAMLAAAPQAAVAAPLPPYNVFSDNDGDSWREHPADADFVEGLQLGDEFELLAGWRSVRVTFRVTKVPDGESDDYEVEEVATPAAAQKGGAA